jgi:hypothetical protein
MLLLLINAFSLDYSEFRVYIFLRRQKPMFFSTTRSRVLKGTNGDMSHLRICSDPSSLTPRRLAARTIPGVVGVRSPVRQPHQIACAVPLTLMSPEQIPTLPFQAYTDAGTLFFALFAAITLVKFSHSA